MPSLLCPICRQPLALTGHSYQCAGNHCFDPAKSGYVNLLLPNSKHSKIPGDNKEMVTSRRDFLNRGYYQPLCDLLCSKVCGLVSSAHLSHPDVLDAGCGEGYYTAHLYDSLRSVCKPDVLGVDISKFALNVAAKRNKEISFGVASIFHLPVEDESCDILLNLFSPYCAEEFSRVLKPGGYFIMVIPGAEHLWELKKAVYDTPYRNEVREYPLSGFHFIEAVKTADEIHLTSNGDIRNLFRMTPYSYKTSQQDTECLQSLEALHTKTEFEILIYQK